jgi:hypothetical protein
LRPDRARTASYLDDNGYESIRTMAGGDVQQIEDISGDGLVIASPRSD